MIGLAHKARCAGSVLIWFAVIEVAVRRVGLERLCRYLGVATTTPIEVAPPPSPLALTLSEHYQLAAVRRLAPRWPFGPGPCLRETLVSGHILRRHQPVLQVGISRRDIREAHAWLVVEGHIIGQRDDFVTLDPFGPTT